MTFNTDEYSVCFDCHECIAFDDPSIDHHIKRELGDRTGHFTIGEECDEFSWRTCDLCHSRLGGSRHTAILHYQGETPEEQFSRLMTEIADKIRLVGKPWVVNRFLIISQDRSKMLKPLGKGEPLIIESTDSLDGQRHEITHPEYTSFYEREISLFSL